VTAIPITFQVVALHYRECHRNKLVMDQIPSFQALELTR